MKERLAEDIKAALLKGDTKVVESLRFIKNSLDGAEKQKGSELSDDEVVNLLRKEVKKREEAADLFEKGGNTDSAKKERSEVALIKAYLPVEMSEDEVRKKLEEIIVSQSIPKETSSMGRVIGLAVQELGVSADRSIIARIAGELLKN